jgi:hypothetical protein
MITSQPFTAFSVSSRLHLPTKKNPVAKILRDLVSSRLVNTQNTDWYLRIQVLAADLSCHTGAESLDDQKVCHDRRRLRLAQLVRSYNIGGVVAVEKSGSTSTTPYSPRSSMFSPVSSQQAQCLNKGLTAK